MKDLIDNIVKYAMKESLEMVKFHLGNREEISSRLREALDVFPLEKELFLRAARVLSNNSFGSYIGNRIATSLGMEIVPSTLDRGDAEKSVKRTFRTKTFHVEMKSGIYLKNGGISMHQVRLYQNLTHHLCSYYNSKDDTVHFYFPPSRSMEEISYLVGVPSHGRGENASKQMTIRLSPRARKPNAKEAWGIFQSHEMSWDELVKYVT